MPDFLLELLSEEIPARMQPAAARELETRLAALLADAGLPPARIEAHATPRRLAAIAWGLPEASAATREERRGPRADAPEAAVAGFLKSTGLTREQLEPRDDPKGRFLYAVLERPGVPAADALAARLPALIEGFPWPKSMRWGAASASMSAPRWVRPLRAITALLDDAVVPFTALGLTTGRETQGHRFMRGRHGEAGSDDGRAITIQTPATYAAQLRAAHVILSADERAQIIRDGAAELAARAGLDLVPDPGLEAENAGLTEWPVPLLGRFDPAFLTVPREVIQLTMRTNQKYFALNGPDGALAPAFVCVANIVAPDGGARILAGNERVLSARLADARFFWERDLKTPLQSLAPKLEQIVFHAKLGTVADKVERVARLARWLAGHIAGCDPNLAERAARLAKCDLVTGTVGEFPEVQGIAGGHLARAQGESGAVADAVRDHYKPVGQGNEVPTAPVSVAVALADKFDTLAALFFRQEIPTGSKDPFALRRAALGLIDLIIRNELRLSLRLPLISIMAWVDGNVRGTQAAYQANKLLDTIEEIVGFVDDDDARQISDDILQGAIADSVVRAGVAAETLTELLQFLRGRLVVQQRDLGTRHDVIDAAFALGDDDLVRLLARVRAVQDLLATDDGANLLAGYRRAANILRKESWDGRDDAAGADAGDALEPAERALGGALASAAPEVARALEVEDFPAAMRALASLRAPIDAFFTDLKVNADDPAIRVRRLALLAQVRGLMHQVADFSKIEG